MLQDYIQCLISTWLKWHRCWADGIWTLVWCCNGLRLLGTLGWNECILHVGWTWILMGHRLDHGRKNNRPKRWAIFLHPEILNLAICSSTWQREIKVVDKIKVAYQLIQRQGNYPRWSGWTQCVHKDLSRGRQKNQCQNYTMWGTLKWLLLTLKMEDAHGMQIASRIWKKQGMDFLLEPSEKEQNTANTLIFNSVRPILDLTSRTVR